jgi:hypothetical protein
MAHGMWTGEGGPGFHEVLTLPEPVRAELGRFLLSWTDTDLGWAEENTRPDHTVGHCEHTPAQVFQVSALTGRKR